MPNSWMFTPIAIPLFAGAVVLLATGVIAWRRRGIPGALYLFWIGITLSVSILSYGVELGAPDVSWVRLTYKIYYLGTLSHAVLLPLMVLDFLGRRGRITRRTVILLSLVPAVSLVLALTNDWHQLIWQNIHIDRSHGYTISLFERGPLYFLPNGYGLLLLITLLVILARAWVQAASGHRPSIVLIMVGILLPNLSFAIYLLGLLPPGLYLEPYLYFVSALVYAVGIIGRRMFDVPPIMHRSIYRILPNAIFIFDMHDRLADINPAAEELFGLDAHHSIGLAAPALFAPWPGLLEIYLQPAEANLTRQIAIRGEPHHLQVRTVRLRGDGGAPSASTMVVRDITREVRAEDALRITYAHLLILHHVDNELNRKLDVDYVASVAIDSAMLLCGGDAAVIGFVAGSEVTAAKVTGLYGPACVGMRLDTAGVTARAIRTRDAAWVKDVDQDAEYVRLAPGMKSQMAAPLIAGERLIGILSVETAIPARFTEDVFESVQLLAARVATALDNARAYEERDQLVGELDAFSHTVAHDLKSPIGVVAGYAEVLAEHYQSMAPERVSEILNLIQTRSLKMAGIVSSLLMLAHVRGVTGVDVTPIRLEDIVREVLLRLDHVIVEKQAVVTTSKRWPVAIGYAPWVEEVLANYVSNALKYGGSPPHIGIHARRLKNAMIRVDVTDNGAGMTEQDRARLFTPFTRLESAGLSEGHGLGLSIVERIVTRLGGEVGVESQLGKGSTFFFTLPTAAASRDQFGASR